MNINLSLSRAFYVVSLEFRVFNLRSQTQYGTVRSTYFYGAKRQKISVKDQANFIDLTRCLRSFYPCKEETLAVTTSESGPLCRVVGSGSFMLEERPTTDCKLSVISNKKFRLSKLDL